MAILGITNRTENWQTAQHFAPLFGHGSVRLARRLLGTGAGLESGDVRLELFWHPVRDWRHAQKLSRPAMESQLVTTYERLFGEHGDKLGEKVEAFRGLQRPSDSYTGVKRTKLASNLANTEIDVVLESPTHLFIGEAKHEMRFHASAAHVLTHQLIREYVTSRVLLDLLNSDKTVVPFVVGGTAADLRRQEQVKFMRQHYGLRPENVLEWSDIEALR